MEIGRSHPSIRDFSGFEFPIFPSDFISKKNPIIEINNRLDKLQIPWGLNEKTVESILRDLEETDVVNQPEYWLLMSRLIESTLICAGHYADHCEFSAAGDLLFNPRKILIHCREHDEPILKNRHGRICDQMNAQGAPHRAFIDWFRSHAEIQIVTPPLLPYLLEHVERSGYISTSYLERPKTLQTSHHYHRISMRMVSLYHGRAVSSHSKGNTGNPEDDHRPYVSFRQTSFRSNRLGNRNDIKESEPSFRVLGRTNRLTTF